MISEEIISTFPIDRALLKASVDTMKLATALPVRFEPKQLLEQGFSRGNGEFDKKYFYNSKDKIQPSLTVAKDLPGRWRLYINANIPKLVHGNNLILPSESDIPAALDSITTYVVAKSGLDFDVLKAKVTRIDYAINLVLPNAEATAFIERVRRLVIPRFRPNKTLEYPTTVYFTSGQRTLRVYNKSVEMELAGCESVIRAELVLTNASTIGDFASRSNFGHPSVENLLSETAFEYASNRLYDLLQISSFDPTQKFSFSTLLNENRCSLADARKAISFTTMIDELGHLRVEDLLGKERYRKDLRLCQPLGY